MMGSQFLHLGGYGREPPSGGDDWSCIGGIIAEVERVKGNHRHIQHPAEPKLAYGEWPCEIGAEATVLSMQAYDKIGRRLRRDGVVLVAGVVTYPMPRADMAGSVVEKDVYEHWKNETIDWLVNASNIAIRSIVEHADEAYMHLHFFALPTLTADKCLDFDAVHPGRKARDAAAASGASPAAVQAAYQNAMVRWQDDFHRDVSANFGHTRYGPKRQRVTRDRRKAIRQVERESEMVRAELELAYRLAATSDETEPLTAQVNPEDSTAILMAENKRLRQELDRKNDIMREFGLVDPAESPLPPLDEALPVFPAIPLTATLAALDELEEFPEPVPAPAAIAASNVWTAYRERQNAGAAKLRSSSSSRREDPEPPDDDPWFLPG